MPRSLPGRSIGGLPSLRSGQLPGRGVDEFTAAAKGKSSSERAALEQRRQQYARELRAQGFNAAVAGSASRIMAARSQQKVSRPMSVLGAISRGLGAIEQGGAGYLRGLTTGVKQGENPLLAIARGVTEIPGAVRKEYGYAQYLHEQIDPKDTTAVGKFIHENAGPIGFGMALVFDPTMYMSFGATSASKQIAYRAIASQYSESAQTARQVLESGGKYGGRKWDDLEDLTLQIHQDAGRPITLHQSLAQQRELGLAGKRAARRGQVPEAGPITTARKTATGYLLPTNVRGGAGVRFAGMEIPGTPRLGEALGRKVRAGKAARIGADEGGGVQRMFVTNFRQKLIADDLKRALALSKMTDFQTSMRVARTQAEKLAAQAARSGTVLGEGVEEVIERPALRVTPESKTAIDNLWTRLEDIPNFDIDYFEDLHVNLGRAMNPRNPMQLGDDEFAGAVAESPGRFFQRLGGLHEYSRSLAQGPKELDEIDELFERVYDNLDTPVPKNVMKSLAGPPARVADDVFRAMEEDLGPGVIKATHVPEEPLGRVADPEQVVAEYTTKANREAAEAVAKAVPTGKPKMIPLGDRLAAEAPIKAYHGTDVPFETMAVGKGQGEDLFGGEGLYATTSPDVAEWYSKIGGAPEEIPEGWTFEAWRKHNEDIVSEALGGEAKAIPPREPVRQPRVIDLNVPPAKVIGSRDSVEGKVGKTVNRVLKEHGIEPKSGTISDVFKDLNELGAIKAQKALAKALYDEHELGAIRYPRFTEEEDIAAFPMEGMEELEERAAAGLKGSEELWFFDQRLVDESINRGKTEAEHMLEQIDSRVTDEMAAAKEMGLSSRATREMWERIKQENPDPAVALANFVWRNQSMVLSRRFLDDMLNEPMFAKPIDKDVLATELPKGQKPFAHPKTGQRYAVLGEIAEALEDFANPVVIDKGTSEALRLMNMPQNFWKQYATLPNPSFHVMNFIGAVWNNMLGSVYNPADYVRAASTVYKAKIEREAETGGRVLGRRAVSTPETRAASQLVEEAEVRGALGSVSIFAELGQGDRMLQDINVPPTVKDRLKSLAVRRPEESKKRYATRQTRRGLAVGLAATANPLALAAMAPELVQVGRRASSAMEDVVRMAPFMKVSKDPTLKQYLHAYGPLTVPGNRHPGFSKGEQAAMYDIAASNVKQFQFDYTDLTDFERRFAKMIFPFYTFYRKNFVLQAQMLAEKPRNTVAALTAINYLNENSDVPDAMRDLLPDYFENIQAVAIPVPAPIREKMGLPQDVPLFLNPKLPFLSLNLLPPVWDVFRDTGQPTKQKVLAAFAPMLGSIGPWAPLPVPGMKMILEASVGEQLGLNKTIDYQRAQSNDWRNSWVPAPAFVKLLPQPVKDFMGVFPWGDVEKTPSGEERMTATGLYFLEQMSTPFVNNLGQTIPVGGPGYEGQKARADLVSWMTGVRLMPVDTLRMHRSWGYRLKSMLESQKADLEDRGERMEPEDQSALRQVRRQVQVLERAWDRQQAELYGPETSRR